MSATRVHRPVAATVALGVLLAVIAVTGPLAAPAGAHAALIGSDPPGGATVEVPPTEITLTFNEAIETDFAQLQVTAPSGARVDAGAPAVQGETAVVPLQPLTENGTYQVAFRVISADGHPIEAGFAFDVTGAAAPVPTTPGPSPTAAATASPSPAQTPSPSPDASLSAAPAPADTPQDVPSAVAVVPTGPSLAGPLLAVLVALLLAGGVYALVRRRTQPGAQAPEAR